MHEGLEKFRRRFADAFEKIEERRDGDSIYQSMLPLPDRNAKITTVEGDSVHLLVSKLFRSKDQGRLGVLMYLLREDSVRIFLIYQSQSHSMWRVAPSGHEGWFGKTNDENQLNLPWTFQRILDSHALDSQTRPELIHPNLFNYLILQPALYAFYDEMCKTVLLGVDDLETTPVQSGAAIDIRRGTVSDVLEWPTQGCIKRACFDSLDREIRYHFVVSPYGFGMSSAEERVSFNKYGLRPMPKSILPLVRPFTDYYEQIDYAFAPVNSHYALRDPVRILADLAQKIDGIQIVPKEVLHFLNSLRKALMGECVDLPKIDEKISARWSEAVSLHS
ncbi:MAG: hypothetical protein ABH842_00480 [Candidatus Micrarchaeota archaeon]